MKRFEFRLQNALELRNRREGACRKRFDRFCALLDAGRTILRSMERERGKAFAQRSGSDLEPSLTFLNFIARLKFNIAQQESRVLRLERICERLRLKLVEAEWETLKLEGLRRGKKEFESEAELVRYVYEYQRKHGVRVP